jgi:hypothetical protein
LLLIICAAAAIHQLPIFIFAMFCITGIRQPQGVCTVTPGDSGQWNVQHSEYFKLSKGFMCSTNVEL